MDQKIWSEVYKLLSRMGANSEILAIIGSRYDTLDDDEILDMLQQCRENGTLNKKIIVQSAPDTLDN